MNIQTKNLAIELDSDDWSWLFYNKLDEEPGCEGYVRIDIDPNEENLCLSTELDIPPAHVIAITAVHISDDGLLITSQSLGLKRNSCDASRLAPILEDAKEVYITCADDSRLLDKTNTVTIRNRGRVAHFRFVIKPTEQEN